MPKCGNCGDPSATVDQIRACHASGPVPKEQQAQNRSTVDPDRIVTTNCMNPTCKVQKTGPLSIVKGFRCPDHGGDWVPDIGAKVVYNGRRFEVLELVDAINIRIRTGGNGKVVSITDVSDPEAA